MSDVAVVIAAFNAASTVDAALSSVAAQTTRPREVIVSDDCSTDGTAAVAQRWADSLPIRILLAERNRGPSAARHAGVEAAESPLIAILDADDVWLPDHLATMTEVHASGAGLVTADPLNWAPGVGLGSRWSERRPVPAADQLLALYRANYVFSGALYGRDLYQQAGGYREQFWGGEDWDLWIRMVRLGAVVASAGHPTVLYRVTIGSLTHGSRMSDDRVGVFELAGREATTPEERRAAEGALRRSTAERSLLRAYRLAGEGRSWAARLQGLGALRGQRRVAVRGVAMALAPGSVNRRREAARADPRARLQE